MTNRPLLLAVLVAGVLGIGAAPAPQPGGPARSVQFVFTSDAHYGITRTAFRGGANVPARTVNRALVDRINELSTSSFPKDGGLRSASPLSFQVATIDPASRTMTVREVLWNADPQAPSAPLAWGASTTVTLSPSPAHARTPTSVGGD